MLSMISFNALGSLPQNLSSLALSSLKMMSFNNWSWWSYPLLAYAAIEINFYIIFHFHLIPKANERKAPPPFRAFGCHDGKDRFMLLKRILDRLERTCEATGQDMLEATAHYLTQWYRFHPTRDNPHPPPPPLRRDSSSLMNDSSHHSNSNADASENSSTGGLTATDDSDTDGDSVSQQDMTRNDAAIIFNTKTDGCIKSNIFKWAINTLCYDDVNDLLACFFFGKHVNELEGWEITELAKMMKFLIDHFDLTIKTGRSTVCTPRLLTLEPVDPWHRPLAVYFGIYAMHMGKAACLWALGFRRYVSDSGLEYFYRPPARHGTHHLPLLFFHGIAPGGPSIYLPMLLMGVANDGRAIFIFENKPISCHLSFEVVSEDDTIAGVQDALEKFNFHGDVALMGHSFGSFQLTWLMYSPLRNRVRQFALLDPVSILLSEPDLIKNFDNAVPLFKLILTELFTNYYIRRHFSWYRSELWLDDFPDNCEFFVGLAEKDQIVNGPKVRTYVEIFGKENPNFAKQTTVAFWPRAKHGDCLYQPSKWRDIRNFLRNTAPGAVFKKEKML